MRNLYPIDDYAIWCALQDRKIERSVKDCEVMAFNLGNGLDVHVGGYKLRPEKRKCWRRAKLVNKFRIYDTRK